MNGYDNKSEQDHKAPLRQPIGAPWQCPTTGIAHPKQRI
jgi:hypothetical protein